MSDYVRKPVSLGELAARARARLAARPRRTPVYRYGDLEIDLEPRRVQSGGTDVGLAPIEFDLLAFLASQPDVTFSRQQLLARVWGSAARPQDVDTVTEHMYRLRRKIEPDPSRPRWLVTVRSAGYRFQP